MQLKIQSFWLLFWLAVFLGATLLTIGIASGQELDFDADDNVADDAPTLDPFVVYEWAASGSSCGLSPELLSAVGHAASYHGNIDGHSYDANGRLTPALYGERGDGSRANLATLFDTDFGAIDDDEFWDRPVGPFQLLPISWRLYGSDANLDGVEDPHNLWDASAAAASFLCAMGAGLPDNEAIAVRNYTGSDALAKRVLDLYTEILADSPFVADMSKEDDAEGKEDIAEVEEPLDPFDHLFVNLDADDDDSPELLGDWNGDGVETSAVFELTGSSFMWMSPIAVAIPLDEDGRPYGAQVRVEVSRGAEALVGDWNDDGYDSIAIRHPLNDEVDVVEFYDRFGSIEGSVVVVGTDDGIDEIWNAIEPPELTLFGIPDSEEPVEEVEDAEGVQDLGQTELIPESLTAANGQDIELIRVEGILVNVLIADALEEMLQDAREDGVELDGWGWRSNERQIELRIQNCEDPWETPSSECSPPTARPGHSRHELGLAIDFHIEGRVITRLDPAFVWLEQHAGIYGLFNLPSEPWHWSVDGR